MKRIVSAALTLFSALALSACVVNPNIYATPIATVHTGYPSPSPEVTGDMTSPDLTNQIGSGTTGNYAVKIVGFERTETADKSGLFVAVTYEWTNNSGEASSFSQALEAKVYQGSGECEAASPTGDDENNPDMASEAEPGSTQTVRGIYRLNDASTPIDIEITERNSPEKAPPTVRQTFEIK